MISFELSTREFKEIKDLNASNYNDNEIFSKEILEKYKEKNKKYKYCSKNMIPKICLPLVCLDNSFIKLTNGMIIIFLYHYLISFINIIYFILINFSFNKYFNYYIWKRYY